MKRKTKSLEKTVTVSHLTVITDASGKQTLVWDWEQLTLDVSNAIAVYLQKEAKSKK